MNTTYDKQLNAFVQVPQKRNEKGTRKNAVIYTRVSSNKQVENTSLEVQKLRCEEYAKSNGYQVMSYFGGTNESAKTEDRKEYNKMLSYIKDEKNEIGYVLVYDFTRFSRSGANAIVTVNELYSDYGVKLVAVTQKLDPTDPNGQFMQGIFFLFSQQENMLRKKRVISGMEVKIKQGHWFGKMPLGYKRIKEKGEICYQLTDDAEKIRQAFIWRAEGKTVPDIRQRLREMGLKLGEKQLFKTLKNIYYCGRINHGLVNEIILGKQPAIVDDETFLRANGQLFVRKTKGNPASELSLKGYIHCDICGRPLTGYYKRDKDKYYYKCQGKGCRLNKSNIKLNDLFYSLIMDLKIEPALFPFIKENIKHQVNIGQEQNKAQLAILEKERKTIAKEIEELESRYAFGKIEKDIYEKYNDRSKSQLSEIEQRINELNFDLSNFLNQVEQSLPYLSELHILWDKAELDSKIALQKCLFPDGIVYDREKNSYRTSVLNEFVLATNCLSRKVADNKKGEESGLCDNSPFVVRRGIILNHWFYFKIPSTPVKPIKIYIYEN